MAGRRPDAASVASAEERVRNPVAFLPDPGLASWVEATAEMRLPGLYVTEIGGRRRFGCRAGCACWATNTEESTPLVPERKGKPAALRELRDKSVFLSLARARAALPSPPSITPYLHTCAFVRSPQTCVLEELAGLSYKTRRFCHVQPPLVLYGHPRIRRRVAAVKRNLKRPIILQPGTCLAKGPLSDELFSRRGGC